MKIETIRLWGDRGDVELTTFLTMPNNSLDDTSKRPAIIVCPGGAYMSCPRHGNEGDPVAMAFAMDGYQAFVLEYSVKDRAKPGQTLFPAQLIDLGKAILEIREHANEWYIDVNKISIIGFSAGAHLCGMLATTWHESLLTGHFGADSEVFKPLSVICLYGLFDYAYQNAYNKEHSNDFLKDMNTHVFGCQEPVQSEEEKYSPYYHVSTNTPPMFLAAAVDDGLVPSIQSVHMAKKLHETGIPYELHMFQFGDHGFSLGRGFREAYREEKKHACAKWLPLAKKFLMHQVSPETGEMEKVSFV